MPDKRKDSLTNNTSKKLKSSDNGSGMSNWLFFIPKITWFIYLIFFQFSDTDAGGHMSFDPVHFIRSHSKNNDPADIQTQVRNILTIKYCFFVSFIYRDSPVGAVFWVSSKQHLSGSELVLK
jgi:hypothetical protein